MLYMDFKHMMTRRLPESSTASVAPGAGNTLWHDARDPVGPPPPYPDTVRRVSAVDLAAQMDAFRDQHVLYLNAVPHVRGAAEEEAKRAGDLEGSSWQGMHGQDHETPLAERARRYIQECGNPDDVPGFGISKELRTNFSQWAEQGL